MNIVTPKLKYYDLITLQNLVSYIAIYNYCTDSVASNGSQPYMVEMSAYTCNTLVT